MGTFGKLDFWMLIPINLKLVKHSAFGITELIMLVIFTILFHIFFFLSEVSLIIYVKLILYLILSITLHKSLIGFMSVIVLKIRNVDVVMKILDSFDQMFSQKPIEIFPNIISFIFLFIIPYIFITGYGFEIIRGNDTFLLWSFFIGWTALFSFLDLYLWKKALENYESNA